LAQASLAQVVFCAFAFPKAALLLEWLCVICGFESMDFFNLETGLKSVSSAGYVMNCQEQVGIQAGLSNLKSKERYSDIYLWGKIFGHNIDPTKSADYYIAYGLRDSEFEFPSKDFYYAGLDFEFKALPRLTQEVADKVLELALEKPFTGNAEELLEAPKEGDEPPAEDGEGEAAPGASQKLVELDRLSQIVQEIDFDTAAVPKGAYSINEAHVVVPSSDFKGLGLTEATSVTKYMHFRTPTSVASLRALARTDIQFHSEFLDSLETDLPKGCWTVRQDPSATLVTLRSLAWPGYTAYHVPGTPKFGSVYFGYGQKNKDLPFIL